MTSCAKTRLPRLVLASASPARLATLRTAGFDPAVRVSAVDEDAILAALAPGTEAAQQVQALAYAKAHDVAAALRDAGHKEGADGANGAGRAEGAAEADGPGAHGALVIGCDSMLEMTDRCGHPSLVGKPGTPERARERWQAMRGRSAQLHTGHWLIRLSADGSILAEEGASSRATVHFAQISDAELDAYIATGEPLQVAGAFTIDGFGAQFITHIEGDHHCILGLSVPLLRELVGRLGLRLTDFWTPKP